MVKLIIGRPPKCDPMGLAGNERIAMKSDCLRQVYLHSNDARLAATELARRAMKQHRHLPKTLVRLIASGLDPWVGTTEEVRVNYLPTPMTAGSCWTSAPRTGRCAFCARLLTFIHTSSGPRTSPAAQPLPAGLI